jgi:O-antigen/teichoic acid export membrane protein
LVDADRPILQRLTDDATVGIYQANYRLGVFMMLVVGMFDLAWRPFFLEQESRPREEADRILARVLTYFVLGAGLVFLGFTLFTEDLVRLKLFGVRLVHPSYWEGLPLVPIVLGAYLVNGVYINFMAQVYFSRRTSLLAYASALGAATSLAANFMLIPWWGMYGAAWSHVLAYFVMAGYLFRSTQKLHPLPYEYGRLAKLAAVLAVLTLIYFSPFAPSPFHDPPLSWLAKSVLLAGYPLCLHASGFFLPEERQAFLRLWNRVRR